MKEKVIVMANQKGGVGKTTTTMNVGCYMVTLGKKVLLIDLDPQANLTAYLGYTGNTPTIGDLVRNSVQGMPVNVDSAIVHSDENGVDYIPSDLNLANAGFYLVQAIGREMILRRLVDMIKDRYDYVLVDCLPSLCVLMMNALAAADGIIIPVQTQRFAVEGLKNLSALIEQMKPINPSLEIVGVLPTMVEANTIVTRDSLKILSELFGSKVFESYISKSTAAPKSVESCKCIPKGEKLGRQYHNLTKEIINRFEEGL